METMTFAEEETAPRQILHSWRLMLDMLTGLPSALPGTPPQPRRIVTHRFDEKHSEESL
jgi:hypothetical protein